MIIIGVTNKTTGRTGFVTQIGGRYETDEEPLGAEPFDSVDDARAFVECILLEPPYDTKHSKMISGAISDLSLLDSKSRAEIEFCFMQVTITPMQTIGVTIDETGSDPSVTLHQPAICGEC